MTQRFCAAAGFATRVRFCPILPDFARLLYTIRAKSKKRKKTRYATTGGGVVPVLITHKKNKRYSSNSSCTCSSSSTRLRWNWYETRGARQTVSSIASSTGLLLVREGSLGVLSPLNPSYFLCSSGHHSICSCLQQLSSLFPRGILRSAELSAGSSLRRHSDS